MECRDRVELRTAIRQDGASVAKLVYEYNNKGDGGI